MISKSAHFKLTKKETSTVSIQEITVLKKSETCEPNDTVENISQITVEETEMNFRTAKTLF